MGYRVILIIAVLLSAMLRWRIYTTDLIGIHLWRQTQTQWNIKNFADYSLNILYPRTAALNEDFDNVVLLEFPIMQWLIGVLYRVTGTEAIFLTRFSLFAISIVTTIGMYRWLSHWYRSQYTGALTASLFLFSPLYYYYAINPLPDVFALCMVAWFCYHFSQYMERPTYRSLILSASFISLAILSKLPFIVFGGGVATYAMYLIIERSWGQIRDVVIAFSLSLIAPMMWYLRASRSWDREGPIAGIFAADMSLMDIWQLISCHLTHWWIQLIVGIPTFLLLMIGGVLIIRDQRGKRLSYRAAFVLGSALFLLIYYIYELNIIAKVHDYYMLPFLPLLFLIIGQATQILQRWSTAARTILATVLLFAAAGYSYHTMQPRWSLEMSYFNEDVIQYKEELKAAVPANSPSIFINDGSACIFSYYMDQWGYMFAEDHLPAGWIAHMITKGGVQYMYSDSRIVDQNPETQQFIDSLLLQKGDVHVYKLKPLD